jgi:hypothetical protein
MTSTDQGMTPRDPAMFAPLTTDENRILSHHLTSGWYKQAAVYPVLSEPWQETSALLDDLGKAFDAAMEAAHGPAKNATAEPHLADGSLSAGPEPELEAGA